MTENAKFITDFLGCDYELFTNEKSGDKIISRFNELTQGKERDFFPLLIVPDDTLTEKLTLELEDAGLENTPGSIAAFRENILREAESVDVQAFFAEQFAEYTEAYDEDILGDFMPGEPSNCLYSHMDGDTPYPELLIAKIPAKNPWELAAWVPMGGFNSCPSPARQAAVFRYWNKKYGAIPVAVTYDIWELGLTKPPLTEKDAEELAKEHFSFCEDCVVQATGTVRALASSLKGGSAWYFWWD